MLRTAAEQIPVGGSSIKEDCWVAVKSCEKPLPTARCYRIDISPMERRRSGSKVLAAKDSQDCSADSPPESSGRFELPLGSGESF